MKKSLLIKPAIIFTLGLFLTMTVTAQSNHAVEVSSNKFDPKELTIQVGDTVTWTNIGGNHNVNGTQSTFPDNLVSFGNEVDSDWTFSFVFNTAGTYDYQCDPHAGFGMVGKVIVQGETASLDRVGKEFDILLYPNPAQNHLNIVLNTSYNYVDVKIYNVIGKKVMDFTNIEPLDSEISIQVASLKAGMYILNIQFGDQTSALRFLKE